MPWCYLFLLIWFVSFHRFAVQMYSVMYETSIIANLCDATRICRKDGEWRIGHTIFSVLTCTRLLRLFSSHDNYKENWTHFIRAVNYVSIWQISAEAFSYCIVYMHLFNGFLFKSMSINSFQAAGKKYRDFFNVRASAMTNVESVSKMKLYDRKVLCGRLFLSSRF